MAIPGGENGGHRPAERRYSVSFLTCVELKRTLVVLERGFELAGIAVGVAEQVLEFNPGLATAGQCWHDIGTHRRLD